MTDPEAFWCDVCQKIDDTPHTPIDHPWTLRGYAHGKRCRETKEKYQTLLKAAQEYSDRSIPIHSSSCAQQPDDWSCICGSSDVYETLLDALVSRGF